MLFLPQKQWANRVVGDELDSAEDSKSRTKAVSLRFRRQWSFQARTVYKSPLRAEMLEEVGLTRGS